jgi:hypothetical protein
MAVTPTPGVNKAAFAKMAKLVSEVSRGWLQDLQLWFSSLVLRTQGRNLLAPSPPQVQVLVRQVVDMHPVSRSKKRVCASLKEHMGT